jgi:hypothetical protein
VARLEVGGAVVHAHELAERGIARELAHRCAVRREAVVAAVHARHGDGDHLALELRQSRRREHEVVVHGREGLQLGVVVRVGAQNVRHEADLLVALGEIGPHLRREFALGEVERRHAAVALLPSRDYAHGRLFGGRLCLRHDVVSADVLLRNE